MQKSHECHSEPQAKNLTIAAPCKCEILRLPPQDDIATQSRRGEGKHALSTVEGRWGLERVEQLERLERDAGDSES
jgi:hypothetical protein